jgi:hypothetical protein
MRPPLRCCLWMLLAASLLGGQSLALAQTAASPPATPSASGPPAAGPAAVGKKSLIAARCKDETAKLCADIAPGGDQLAACLRSHEATLSAACRAAVLPARHGAGKEASPICPPGAIASTGAATGAGSADAATTGGAGTGPKKMRHACVADVAKFCKDVPQGRGRIAACLSGHASELSAGCKPAAQEVAARMNARVQMRTDCAADVQKLCADMPPGPGRTGFCLSEHASELSPACKKHVDEMKARPSKAGKAAG